MLIGGGGERKTLRIVARHADIWHGFGDVATIAHKNGVLDEWCAKEGRDPERDRALVRRAGPPTADRRRPLRRRRAASSRSAWTAPTTTSAPSHDWLAWRDDKNAG